MSVVKSEASFELSKNMKTCSKQVRTDGKTLVNQFDKPMDRFLALAKEVEPVLPSIKNEIAAGTPESMASPMTDEVRLSYHYSGSMSSCTDEDLMIRTLGTHE